jgi:hypothetical protein
MSFLTVIESAATDVETAVVSGLKTAVTYVDNVTVTELIPELESALMTALGNFAQTEIAAALAAIKSVV